MNCKRYGTVYGWDETETFQKTSRVLKTRDRDVQDGDTGTTNEALPLAVLPLQLLPVYTVPAMLSEAYCFLSDCVSAISPHKIFNITDCNDVMYCNVLIHPPNCCNLIEIYVNPRSN